MIYFLILLRLLLLKGRGFAFDCDLAENLVRARYWPDRNKGNARREKRDFTACVVRIIENDKYTISLCPGYRYCGRLFVPTPE